MNHEGGAKKKPHRGPKKNTGQNRFPKNQNQQRSWDYHGDAQRSEPSRHNSTASEPIIKDKQKGEMNLDKPSDKQILEENVTRQVLDNTVSQSNCSNPWCMKTAAELERCKEEIMQQAAEIQRYKETIRKQEEMIQLQSREVHKEQLKDDTTNASMEANTSINSAVSLLDEQDHLKGLSWGDMISDASDLEGKYLQEEEVKGDCVNVKESSPEQDWVQDNTKTSETDDSRDWTEPDRYHERKDKPWNVEDRGTRWERRNASGDRAQDRSQERAEMYNRPRQQQDPGRHQMDWQPRNINRGYGAQDRHPERGERVYGAWQQQGREIMGPGQQRGRGRNRPGQPWGGEGNRRDNQGGQPRKRVLKEIDGDLFTAPEKCSLAHCVAEDMRMGSGIAVTFRQMFKRVDELLQQGVRTGGVAILEDKGRYIYYLVTKKYSNVKPSLEDLRSSLIRMREHMLANGVHDIAMPRIGCGLDRLEWFHVKMTLIEIFGDDDVEITVYNYNEEQGERTQPKSSLWIKHADYGLINIERGTALLYLGSEDGAVSESLENLLPKYPILPFYKQQTKCIGEFIHTECKGEVLYGLIVRKRKDDEFSFTAFSQCLEKVKSKIKKDDYKYVGIDVVSIGDDLELGMEKLLTLFKNAWFRFNVELYICWPQKYAAIRDEKREKEFKNLTRE